MDPVPPKSRDRAPTIRDVARHAKVGVGTVSRVLNDSPLVSDDARQRVHQTIDRLGYRRSSMARSLSLGRTQMIGVVAPFFTSNSVLERLRGVVGKLRDHGDYDLVLFDVETLTQRDDAFRSFARTDRVDGLLVMSLRPTDEEVESLRREGLPAVLVDVVHPALPRVVIDDVLGGTMATEHLLAKGHTVIGFVGDEETPFGFTSSERRRQGMARALRRAGIKRNSALEFRAPHGREEARASAERLLRLPEPPTAIFAASDVQAIGVLEAARSGGLRVPEDLAVIGFDDIEVAEMLGLTTVRQPLRETGARGVELLLAAIDGIGGDPTEELAPLTVIERRTT
ncbi:MAG TPA: LacI family DNA-binding transcriptional regulator [Solirubrobacteraceae bacterium]|jgi:DNA-binding LacI/PurR family transcriptional regulator|nr:LacI family DNA-binding transcriptional regulator [Solirubrobacteraceae bacterium]